VKILVSNDDGYFAPGIALLAEALRQLGEVTVVAPERDRSGASNSLTLDRPLTVRRAPNGYFSVNGTPTDCVHLAVTGLLDFVPDLVVSGVNLGANMGDDTIYSGTVAAAAETPNFSSISLMSCDNSRTVMFAIASSISALATLIVVTPVGSDSHSFRIG